MKTYTYSQARQRLANLLDEARREGRVRIRRRDGQLFDLQPVATPGSPLDVPAVKARLRPGEVEQMIRDSRRSVDRLWKKRSPRTSKRSKPRTSSGRPAK